jgi:hypothetical protein
MCLRLSSREKKKNRNSPSRKTVGDKQAHPLASKHSLASPSETGKAPAADLTRSCQGPGEYGCLHLPNGLDRSCEATIYPVSDKPHSTGILGGQRPQTIGDISARFSGSLYDWPR